MRVVGKCRLRELLLKKDMKQSELAELLGVTPPQINKYVNGKQYMSIRVAKEISCILNCTIEDLYTWKYEKRAGNKE